MIHILLEVSPITLYAIYYELIILILSGWLLTQIILRYIHKKTQLVALLFGSFLSITVCIFFIMLSKVIYVYMDGQYMTDATPGYWWFIRIMHYRIGFIFLVLSSYFIFVFRGKIFEKAVKKGYQRFMVGFLIFIWLYLLFVFDKDNSFYPIFAFGLVFIYTSIVYFPMMINTYRISKKVVEYDPNYRSAFLSLSIMCFSFIMLFVFFIADQVIHMVNGATYTLFYFIGWLFVIFGEIFAYYGYIRPKSSD